VEYPRPGPICAPFTSDEDLSPVRIRDDSLKDVMLKISMILNKNLLHINLSIFFLNINLRMIIKEPGFLYAKKKIA
jgi:hypothetical protein